MKKTIIAISLAFAVTLSSPVSACRVMQSAETRLSSGYKNDIITAVSLVEVTDVKIGAGEGNEFGGWLAETRNLGTLQGDLSADEVRIFGGRGSAACELNDAPASIGETWVVYFWTDNSGIQKVWLALPYTKAAESDPRISMDEPSR